MAYNVLVQATVIALSLVVKANSLDINVQPEFVHPKDENVVISCASGDNSTMVLEKMLRMRLMKLDDDDDDQWNEVAVLGFDGSIILTSANATAEGHLADVLHSYLVVTWPVAPDDIHGRYQCDAIALTHAGEVVREQSGHAHARSRPTDLSLILKRLGNSERALVGKVNETLHRAMESSKANLFSVLDSKFETLMEFLDNRTAVAVSNARRLEEEVKAVQWPEGEITLLMPSDGCPLHPPAWIKSFFRMKTQPDDKYYPINVPLHLANPHKKDGFIYRQFCTLPALPERKGAWPAGKYCLYSHVADITKSCPTGFVHTQSVAKVLNDEGNFYLFYYPDKSQKSGTFYVDHTRFCCRHDGNASTPIDLPVAHPFYLVRHGGMCQEVRGMDVTQDVFMMETVNDDSYDKWINDNTDFRPDVSFKPYKENLCYYSRRRG